jgi:hypothetical protein
LGLPEIWYGIWSAPDTYDSVISKHPGQTMFTEHTANDKKVQGELELNWTDFPVTNMHPHAWPLYSSVKLLGLEFHEGGLSLQPKLPLAEYAFSSPLLGYKKSKERISISGWYAPATAGRWEIELRLSDSELTRLSQVEINGKVGAVLKSAKGIRFSGESRPGASLRWEIS